MARQTTMTKRSIRKTGRAVKSPSKTARIESMLARISDTTQPSTKIGGFVQDQVGPTYID
jgi:hypothetical protein